MVYLIVFFAVLGIVLLLWALVGLWIAPVFGPELVTFCPSRGDGVHLEQQVMAYGWLREGKRRGGRFVIVDCGLSPSGACLADRLADVHDWVTVLKKADLGEFQEYFISNTETSKYFV